MVINIKKEILSVGHSFWTLTLAWEQGEWIRVYGQTLGQALENLAHEVKAREREAIRRDQAEVAVEVA